VSPATTARPPGDDDGASDGLDREIHAPLGEGVDRRHGVPVGGGHEIRGAQLGCEPQALEIRVQRHDPAGTRDARPLHRRQTDTATAEDGDGLAPGCGARGGRRAEAGADSAADQARRLQRYLVGNRNHRARGHGHPLCQAGNVHVPAELSAPERERAVVGVRGDARTHVGATRTTGAAAAAAGCPRDDHALPHDRLGDTGSDGLDPPGGLVTQHGREADALAGAPDVQVAGTDPAGDEAHPHLAGTGVANGDLLHS
jgi:hypothetical protein